MNSAELRERLERFSKAIGTHAAPIYPGRGNVWMTEVGADEVRDLLDRAATALVRLEELERVMATPLPTTMMRATVGGSVGYTNGVLEEQDYDGNWHEVAWSEYDRPPMETLRELLATYAPIGSTPAPAGQQGGEG